MVQLEWVMIIGLLLAVPQFPNIESVIRTGKLPVKQATTSAHTPLKASVMMKAFVYAGIILNTWWFYIFVKKFPIEQIIYHSVCTFLLADIWSGLYHWIQDSYRTSNETVNKALFENFQLHHAKPYMITKHDWEYNTFELGAIAAIGQVVSIIRINRNGNYDGYVWFRTVLCFVLWINHVHRYNHMKLDYSLPWPLQNRKHHANHHVRPELEGYCILSVLNNGWMDKLGVWEIIEWVVYYITGHPSYRMAVNNPEKYQQRSYFSLEDVLLTKKELSASKASVQ